MTHGEHKFISKTPKLFQKFAKAQPTPQKWELSILCGVFFGALVLMLLTIFVTDTQVSDKTQLTRIY